MPSGWMADTSAISTANGPYICVNLCSWWRICSFYYLLSKENALERQSVKVNYKLATSTAIKENTMDQSIVVSERVIKRPIIFDCIKGPWNESVKRKELSF